MKSIASDGDVCGSLPVSGVGVGSALFVVVLDLQCVCTRVQASARLFPLWLSGAVRELPVCGGPGPR